MAQAEAHPHLHCFLLSGGAGTRLWPYSRKKFPKQFLDFSLANQQGNLFVESLKRIKGLGKTHIISTNELEGLSKNFLARESLDAKLWSEPCARNTAAAVLLGTQIALNEDPEALCAFFPADHHITEVQRLRACVMQAFTYLQQNPDTLLCLGMKATYPATAYGYIRVQSEASTAELAASGADTKSPIYPVDSFIEKPEQEKAQALLNAGNVYWNAGIFIFKAATMLRLFKEHQSEMAEAFSAWDGRAESLEKVYQKLPSISLDYAIVEKTKNIACLPVDLGWSDVGSWEEVARLKGEIESQSSTVEIEAQGNFFFSPENKQKAAAFIGVSDLVVVDTPDALLVAKKGEGQKLRSVVEHFAKSEQCKTLTEEHPFEERPWGRFEVLLDTEHFKSKRICVLPQKRLSYQSHQHRSEHWVIVRGEALVTLNDKDIHLKSGEHIHIPQGAKHRIANPGNAPMEFIEVQSGSYFGEDDITRYQDDFDR